MENFFNNDFEFNLFKRAIKLTDNEPVVLNMLASDDSLKQKGEVSAKTNTPVLRKSMSEKFEPSPFGKYFGSRKKRTTPLDMSDFSSWKNKNYRNIEKKVMEEKSETSKQFSLSEYMKNKSAGKFIETDQAVSDQKKPITQLSIDDPDLKKYALNSYLYKLEEGVIAGDKFKENEDLLDPILNFDENVKPSSDDEDFSSSSVDIEHVAFADDSYGENFSLDKNELDELRRRLDKLEQDSNTIREKTQENNFEDKTIGSEEERFSLSSLFDEEEQEETVSDLEFVDNEEDKQEGLNAEDNNIEFAQEVVDNKDEKEETVSDLELIDNEEDKQEELNAEDNNVEVAQELVANKDEQVETQNDEKPIDETQFIYDLNKIIERTKKYRDTNKQKVNAKNKKSNILTKEDYESMTDDFISQFSKTKEFKYENNELESKIIELTAKNKRANEEANAKIKKLQADKVKENKDKELLFKKELTASHNISNLEMDKKLLQTSNKNKNEEDKNSKNNKVDVSLKADLKKPKTTRKKRGKSRKRIDSDIIGGIVDFE